jgi:hypothetical protein
MQNNTSHLCAYPTPRNRMWLVWLTALAGLATPASAGLSITPSTVLDEGVVMSGSWSAYTYGPGDPSPWFPRTTSTYSSGFDAPGDLNFFSVQIGSGAITGQLLFLFNDLEVGVGSVLSSYLYTRSEYRPDPIDEVNLTGKIGNDLVGFIDYNRRYKYFLSGTFYPPGSTGVDYGQGIGSWEGIYRVTDELAISNQPTGVPEGGSSFALLSFGVIVFGASRHFLKKRIS